MLHIEGRWETVDNLRDVSRIIRECYNSELADEMDSLIDEYVEEENYSQQVYELENIIERIRDLVW